MSQLDIFSSRKSFPVNDPINIGHVEGLTFIENYVTKIEHDEIISSIDSELWMDDLKRRVQHYGYKYNYKRRSIDYDMYLGALPQWSENIINRLTQDKLINYIPDQIIVNEYLPGQGIANHIDCEPCFNDTIISLSLISSCVMDIKQKNGNGYLQLLLPPRSLVILKGEARYGWSHGIPARKVDEFNGSLIHRQRRISLTFRKVILSRVNSNNCEWNR